MRASRRCCRKISSEALAALRADDVLPRRLRRGFHRLLRAYQEAEFERFRKEAGDASRRHPLGAERIFGFVLMPYAITPDKVKLYYEEVGPGHADPVRARIRLRSSRLGAAAARIRQALPLHRLFRARLYAVRRAGRPNAYSYQHVMRDAVAVLDHLKIDTAHLIGLSMGGYTSLQVALNHPERVRSMVLAGTGSGSERWYTADFHKHSRALGDSSSAKARPRWRRPMARARAAFLRDQGSARLCRILAPLAEHDAQGLGQYLARLPGRAAVALRFRGRIRKLATPALIVVGDEDDRCIEPSLFLKRRWPRPGW